MTYQTEVKSYHHPFSPSSLGRRRLCPGSFQIEQGSLRCSDDNAAGIEGSKLHTVMALQIEERKADPDVKDPAYVLNMLSVEQKNTVLDSMCWLDDTIEHACMDVEHQAVNYKIEVEQPMEWKDGEKVVCSGTADAIIYPPEGIQTPYRQANPKASDKQAFIIDWKFGRAAIEPANATLQLLGYAVLTFEKDKGIKEVVAYIYQPRVGAIYQAQFTRRNLKKYKKEITDTIEACLVPDPVLEPSTAACNYCKGISVCPEVEKMAHAVSKPMLEQGAMSDPEEAISALLAEKTPAELGDLYDRSKVVMQYAKAVKDFCKTKMLEDEDNVEGWKLQNRKGRKRLTDNFKAAEALGMPMVPVLEHGTIKLSDLGPLLQSPMISRAVLLQHANISVSSLQKAYIERHQADHDTSKAQARRDFEELLKSVMETGDDTNAIVKEAKND